MWGKSTSVLIEGFSDGKKRQSDNSSMVRNPRNDPMTTMCKDRATGDDVRAASPGSLIFFYFIFFSVALSTVGNVE